MKLQTELSDQQLLDVFHTGNLKAYDLLFERYFKRLYGFAFSLLKDSEIAKELAMDVMVKLWQKEGKIDVGQSLKPYLFKAVRNSVYSHLRKSKLITQSLDLFAEYSEITEVSADTPFLCKELEGLYESKLNGLSPQRRKIFEFSRTEELTYVEIAEKMSLSVNTVRNQMSATLKYFRKHMDEYHEVSILLILIFTIFYK